MKKIIFFLLITTGIRAQVPTEYSPSELNFVVNFVAELEKTKDIVIDPIERLPIRPTEYSTQASGNWGSVWTGATKHESELVDRSIRKVVVFIFDTAPFFNHPALDGFAWNEKGRSYTGEPDLIDRQGHGHHVAGIIGARSDKYDLGIARALVGKGLLKTIPIEVLDDFGSGAFSWVERAILDANDEAVKLMNDGWFVIYNFSLGSPTDDPGTARALKEAAQLGIFICAASGNTSLEGIEFPGRASGVNAIGSINNDGSRSSFSSYGDGLYMVAPGRSVLSTWTNGEFVELSGTSMATPAQCALVAIAASVHPNLSASQIKKLLIDVVTDLDPGGYDKFTGNGYDYIGKILSIETDPTEPDEPEKPTKKQRLIDIVIQGNYNLIYQRSGGGFTDFSVTGLVIRLKTNLYAEDASDMLESYVNRHFSNRGYILRDDADFLDAGYWAGRFLEIIAANDNLKLDVIDITAVDERGHKGKPKRPGVLYFSTPKRISSLRY